MTETDIIKNKLRAELKTMRKGIGNSRKSILDLKIFSNVLKCEAFKNAKTVLAYKSTDIEVGTDAIIKYCLENGKKIALPKCMNGGLMKFYYYNGNTPLVKSTFGIMEPIEDENNEIKSFENTVCILPALAFDNEGYRLGYGGGYYDRFLSAHENLITIGICYFDNIQSRLVRNGFDRNAAFVATEKSLEAYNGK